MRPSPQRGAHLGVSGRLFGRRIREDALEEERRMFYVAVTRAADSLHIFYTKPGYNADNGLSRFVKELFGPFRMPGRF